MHVGIRFGLEKVDPSYFDTDTRLRQLREAKNREVVALDHNLPTSSSSSLQGNGSVDNVTKAAIHTTQNDGTGKGTVGCVCMFNGHVAAGTSTGGMTNKACGRIGDTPGKLLYFRVTYNIIRSIIYSLV